MSSDVHDLKGRVLEDRYHVERCLGSGGMGSVWKAEDAKFEGGRTVVVKIPHAEVLRRPGFRDRFEREVRSLVKLELSGVVRVLDVGRVDDTPFCVMQHLGGGCLDLQHGGAQSAPQVLRWLAPVARILDRIHRRGWVHRDVKPDNILFDDDGEVHVADLGLAKAVGDQDSGLTMTGHTPGTPKYMAPECASPDPIGPASDQYALAVMAYEAMAGCLPHEGTSAVELLSNRKVFPAAPLDEAAPQVSAPLSAVVARALEREPANRFGSCVEFANAFAAAADSAIPALAKRGASATGSDMMSAGPAPTPRDVVPVHPGAATGPPAEGPAARPKSLRLSIALGKLKFSLTIACSLMLMLGFSAWYLADQMAVKSEGPGVASSSGEDAEGPPSGFDGMRSRTEGDSGPSALGPEGDLGPPSDGEGEVGKAVGKEGDEGFSGSRPLDQTGTESAPPPGNEFPPDQHLLAVQPPSGAWLIEPLAVLQGTVAEPGLRIEVEGLVVPVDENGTFSITLKLPDPRNEVTVISTDAAGKRTERKLLYHVDPIPPRLTIDAPPPSTSIAAGTEVTIEGTAANCDEVEVEMEGTGWKASVKVVDGSWKVPVAAPAPPEGKERHTVTVRVRAKKANSNSVERTCQIHVTRE